MEANELHILALGNLKQICDSVKMDGEALSYGCFLPWGTPLGNVLRVDSLRGFVALPDHNALFQFYSCL